MAQNKPNYDLYGMRQTRLTRCKGLIHAGLDCRGLKSPANAFVVTDLSSEHIVDKSFEIFQRELGLTNSWFAPTPCTVYDVGGNVGYFTISSAALGCSVQSFEPLQANFQRLQLGVQANGFQNSTTLHRFGLGYEKGTAYHFRAPAHKVLRSGGIFLSGEDDALDEWKEGTNWTSTPLQVHSLDQLDFPKAPVFAVNVDAKGFESMFVSGAEKFFASCRPHLVFMEVLFAFRLSVRCLVLIDRVSASWTTIFGTPTNTHQVLFACSLSVRCLVLTDCVSARLDDNRGHVSKVHTLGIPNL